MCDFNVKFTKTKLMSFRNQHKDFEQRTCINFVINIKILNKELA